jgi:hypothetical protein
MNPIGNPKQKRILAPRYRHYGRPASVQMWGSYHRGAAHRLFSPTGHQGTSIMSTPAAFQAGYPNTTGFRKVVKATVYIKKKHGMSDEDFIEYYNNNHAQRAVPILQRHGIISYSLVKQPFPAAIGTSTTHFVADLQPLARS